MSSLPALAIDNTAPQPPPQPRSMRLSDAEKIAADRLDTTPISSLKAALAGVTAAALPTAPRLVERIDAAAKLAADATAAAEAVETLKRLLQAQLATNRPLAESTAVVPLSVGPRAVPARAAEALPSAPLGAEQRRPDVRGFLAGFVISGAIGAVLYLYMMAG
ncbi:MAG TPA: hypothetical protein VFR19_00625 [Hyphomicrobiaceae bacterium]|nr:hypothetical protein [Hyphomicrobiaceae bacterium]